MQLKLNPVSDLRLMKCALLYCYSIDICGRILHIINNDVQTGVV